MISIFELSPDHGLIGATAAQPAEIELTDGVLRWVRIIGNFKPESHRVLGSLKLSESLLEVLFQNDVESRVETHKTGMVMTLPVAEPKSRQSCLLRVACNATTLVTIEEHALPTFDRVITEQSNTAGMRLTLPALLVNLVEAAVGTAGPIYLSLSHKLERLAAVVEGNPREVPPEQLLAIRSDVARLTLLWHEQIHGVRELARCHSYVPVTDSTHDQLRDLISDGGRGLKLLAQMESRLRDLRQHQQQFLQESTNRRLNMLAILSSIYMPATLIAGIYGMNFENIPVTQLSYGYYIIMAFMAIVVAGHFWYFFWRGWFR